MDLLRCVAKRDGLTYPAFGCERSKVGALESGFSWITFSGRIYTWS